MSQAKKMAPPKPWQMDLSAGMRTPADSSCVGIADTLEPEALLNFAIDSKITHICQKSGHLYDEELKSANSIIECEENYFQFPASTILTPDSINPVSEKSLIVSDQCFDNSAKKPEVLQNLTDAMQSKALSQTIMDDVIAVADELYTNVIFNAPFVDLHTQTNPGISRNAADVQLEAGKEGRLFFAHDAKRIVIGCADPFGTLDLNKYLCKIRSTYQKGPAAAINFGPGGAGIGSYIIFNAGSSLYFGVSPGQLTLLSCVIPLGMSNRKRMQLSKHVHWIKR